MNNFRYRLTSPRVFEKCPTIEKVFDNDVIVRPLYLSICAADQRYFFGKRKPKVLKQKLPLSLIHECVGVVTKDSNGFKKGDNVILYPNLIKSHNKTENYDTNSKFMSSSVDGFMQDLICINKSNLIKIDEQFKELDVMTMCEVLSVVIHAIETSKPDIQKAEIISLWGDGNLSYLCHLYLLKTFPDKKIILYGVNDDKMEIFSNKIKKINILKENKINYKCDICIEMVGGEDSSFAINKSIDCINPLGKIILLGVSENDVPINTRMILEKGITLIGRSRSTKNDFIKARNFIYKYSKEIKKIISEVISVNNTDKMIVAFNMSKVHKFKTVMKWDV